MTHIFNLRQTGKQIMMHPHNGHSIIIDKKTWMWNNIREKAPWEAHPYSDGTMWKPDKYQKGINRNTDI